MNSFLLVGYKHSLAWLWTATKREDRLLKSVKTLLQPKAEKGGIFSMTVRLDTSLLRGQLILSVSEFSSLSNIYGFVPGSWEVLYSNMACRSILWQLISKLQCSNSAHLRGYGKRLWPDLNHNPQHYAGGTEENYEQPQQILPASRPKISPRDVPCPNWFEQVNWVILACMACPSQKFRSLSRLIWVCTRNMHHFLLPLRQCAVYSRRCREYTSAHARVL